MTDLRDRIASAIARKTAAKAPDEVLSEIRKTHHLIDHETMEWLIGTSSWECCSGGERG